MKSSFAPRRRRTFLSCAFACLGLVALPFIGLGNVAATSDWEVLFDGSDLSAWRPLHQPAGTPIRWEVEDGAIAWRKDCGDLITRRQFRDFELELEWKISPGANSGVMFRVDESLQKPWHSGPEIQLLDPTGLKNAPEPLQVSGSLYGLFAPLRAAERPAGEWNTLRLRVTGAAVQCWMNGQLIVDVLIDSPLWRQRVAQSKFSAWPTFARAEQGHILLQDHFKPVWFRAIRIRRL